MKKRKKPFNKKITFLCLILTAAMLFGACAKSGTDNQPVPQKTEEQSAAGSREESQERSKTETAKEPSSAKTDSASEVLPAQQQSEGTDLEETEMKKTDFYGAALTDAAYKEMGGNTVMSPLSINIALAMALEGAEGRTKEEIENYLGITKDGLGNYISELLTSISSTEEATVMISNAFWYLTGLDVNGDYLKTLQERYAAEAGEMDFTRADQAADLINEWCAEHTNGLIPNIVSASDIASASDLILNTLYFKNAWRKPIEVIRTEPFYGLDQEKDAELLYSEEGIYFENDQATAFAKPYLNKYSFIGILPKEEGDFDLADLDIESLLASRTYDYEVHAVMPKLNIESGGSITGILQEMGIRKAFTPDADFSGIADQLYISDVIHKTKLLLDENGTEAAAATAVMMVAGAFIQDEVQEKTVRLDRPYAFMIVDDQTGTVLFIGKVVEP